MRTAWSENIRLIEGSFLALNKTRVYVTTTTIESQLVAKGGLIKLYKLRVLTSVVQLWVSAMFQD